MCEGTALIAVEIVQTLLLVAFLAEYIRLRRSALHVVRSVGKKMECDDLIDQLLSEDPPAGTAVALPHRTTRRKNWLVWLQLWLVVRPKNIWASSPLSRKLMK